MKEQLLRSFSLVSNIQILLKMDATPKGMECLNGIRVISMTWILVVHQMNMRDVFSSTWQFLGFIHLSIAQTKGVFRKMPETREFLS